MKIGYKATEKGMEIHRVMVEGGHICVPGRIEGEAVFRIAPYAFSAHKQEEEGLSWYDDGTEEEETLPVCSGVRVTSVVLPKEVREIGNYAFYGCMNMKRLHVTDQIDRMGSGVFTGCRLSEVEIDFYDGEKSCLKEILTEIRYEVYAVLNYGMGTEREGGKAKLLFPEFYADAVENTPARIVETHYYGSGGDYRECFYRRELDYTKYDEMFVLSEARDDGESTAVLSMARLLYPYKLSKKAEDRYRSYVMENLLEIIEYIGETARNDQNIRPEKQSVLLKWMCEENYFTEYTLENGIEILAEMGQTELMTILMDARQSRFGTKKKTFDL